MREHPEELLAKIFLAARRKSVTTALIATSISCLSAPLATTPRGSLPFVWKITDVVGSILRMRKLLLVILSMLSGAALAADLPTKKYLDLNAVKTMVVAAEAEAKQRNVSVTICIVDESGNLLFVQRGDGTSLNTLDFAQKKARHAASYKSPSKDGADAVKKGNVEVLAFPSFFPNQGGLPILADGQILGGISASGAKSEIDEAIAQAGLDALFKK
jgi:glc operon protein GlcG